MSKARNYIDNKNTLFLYGKQIYCKGKLKTKVIGFKMEGKLFHSDRA